MPKVRKIKFVACKIEGCKANAHHTSGGSHKICRSHKYRIKTFGDPNAGMARAGEPAQWMLDHVGYEGDDCLIFPFTSISGRKDRRATVTFGGKSHNAPRLMCILAHGEPPTQEHHAAHNCGKGDQNCVNPRHMAWKTVTENMRDKNIHGTMHKGEIHYYAKLNENLVRLLRDEHAKGSNMSALARELGVSLGCVWGAVNRTTWKDVI